MKFVAIFLCLALSKIRAQEYWTQTKVLTPGNSAVPSAPAPATEAEPETTQARWSRTGVPVDNAEGNYGDLIHRCREDNDKILVREIVINQEMASVEQDIVWSVSIPGYRVTSVRVLNFGRQRAYCLRIDVLGGDVQIICRIPALLDPRIIIEVYGL